MALSLSLSLSLYLTTSFLFFPSIPNTVETLPDVKGQDLVGGTRAGGRWNQTGGETENGEVRQRAGKSGGRCVRVRRGREFGRQCLDQKCLDKAVLSQKLDILAVPNI